MGYGVDMYGDAYREPPGSQLNITEGWSAGVGGFLHGYWYFYQVPPEDAQVNDITKLKHLAQPGNFLTLGHLLPRSLNVAIRLHADGLAAAIDICMAKDRVGNPAMAFVQEALEAIPAYAEVASCCSISHEYGLGNSCADAASRNSRARVYALCASMGVHPVQV